MLPEEGGCLPGGGRVPRGWMEDAWRVDGGCLEGGWRVARGKIKGEYLDVF